MCEFWNILKGSCFWWHYIVFVVIWSHYTSWCDDVWCVCRKSRIMATSELDNPSAFSQLFWKLPCFAFSNIRGTTYKSQILPRMLYHGFQSVQLHHTLLGILCLIPLFRSSFYIPYLCYLRLQRLPHNVGYFPLVTGYLFIYLFLLKPEPCNLTTLATASGERSLLSRTYSLVMDTNVHEKITSNGKQGMKCDETWSRC